MASTSGTKAAAQSLDASLLHASKQLTNIRDALLLPKESKKKKKDEQKKHFASFFQPTRLIPCAKEWQEQCIRAVNNKPWLADVGLSLEVQHQLETEQHALMLTASTLACANQAACNPLCNG